MKLLYEGAAPPNDFISLIDVREIADDEAASMFAAGRALDNNYQIIVRIGGMIRYWYPTPTP